MAIPAFNVNIWKQVQSIMEAATKATACHPARPPAARQYAGENFSSSPPDLAGRETYRHPGGDATRTARQQPAPAFGAAQRLHPR